MNNDNNNDNNDDNNDNKDKNAAQKAHHLNECLQSSLACPFVIAIVFSRIISYSYLCKSDPNKVTALRVSPQSMIQKTVKIRTVTTTAHCKTSF